MVSDELGGKMKGPLRSTKRLWLRRGRLTREPGLNVNTVSRGFRVKFRHECISNRFREERFERRQFGAFLLAAHRRSLPQLVTQRQIGTSRRAITGNDAAKHDGGGENGMRRPFDELRVKQRPNMLSSYKWVAAACTHNRRQTARRVGAPVSISSTSSVRRGRCSHMATSRHGG